MKFINKYSEQTLRYFVIIIGLITFLISSYSFLDNSVFNRMTNDDCLWIDEYKGVKAKESLFIVQIVQGGVTDKAGVKDGDMLVEINGKKFKDIKEAQWLINQAESGEVLTYTLIRGNEVLKISFQAYKFFNLVLIVSFFLSLGFLIIGFVVGYSKPKEITSQIFFFLSMAFALSYSPGLDYFSGYPWMIVYSYIVLKAIGGAFVNPLFIHFFITYPIKYEFKRRKLFLWIIYGVSIIVTLLTFFITVNLPGFAFLSGIYMSIGFHYLIKSYRKSESEIIKKSFRVIIGGFILGFIGLTYLLVYTVFVKKATFLVSPLWFAPFLLVLAIPVSFGYSIFKYKILDTEFIIKKGLVFGILTSIIVLFYLGIVYTADSFLSGYIGTDRKIITFTAIIVITFTFDFFNKRAKDFVDKQFYKDRYNYRKALLDFSQELPKMKSIRQVLDKLGISAKQIMGIAKLNVWIYDERYLNILKKELQLKEENKTISFKDIWLDELMTKIFKDNSEPVLLSDIEIDELNLSEQDVEAIRKANIYLAVPIYLKDKLVGALNFSKKPSGKEYSEEDLDLLKTIASQTAISFESARLQLEEVDKQKIDEELGIARKIQESLLPDRAIEIEGLDLTGSSSPAKTIGGDFYDLIKISDKKLLVIVADVSGKGIPAALNLSKVQAMIQFSTKVFDSPKEILKSVNKQIYNKIDRKSFVTIAAGLFDLEKMTLKLCRAGHNPILYANNTEVKEINSKGIGLGLDNAKLFDANLQEVELKLKKDDIFLFYSDGLTEAMNSFKEEFGLNIVKRILEDNVNGKSADIQRNLIDEVTAFKGSAEQNDDITLVTIKIK
ncbi:MAG: SpoIIE family protein phosphatase [Ignavibacteria bacterium]|nr:SpoIIE family protein phosphatase [Ignavibacteria bacterium]